MLAAPGIGTATQAWRVTCRRMTICRCSTRWTMCPKTALPRGLRFTPTVRQSPRNTICTSQRSSRRQSRPRIWDEAEELWHIRTDRGDHMRAQFVICANGTLSKPKLTRIAGMESFQGHSFHTSRWDYDYTGEDLSGLADKVVGIIGTGATAGSRRFPAWGKRPGNYTCSNARRLRLTSATIIRPIPTGRDN